MVAVMRSDPKMGSWRIKLRPTGLGSRDRQGPTELHSRTVGGLTTCSAHFAYAHRCKDHCRRGAGGER